MSYFSFCFCFCFKYNYTESRGLNLIVSSLSLSLSLSCFLSFSLSLPLSLPLSLSLCSNWFSVPSHRSHSRLQGGPPERAGPGRVQHLPHGTPAPSHPSVRSVSVHSGLHCIGVSVCICIHLLALCKHVGKVHNTHIGGTTWQNPVRLSQSSQ